MWQHYRSSAIFAVLAIIAGYFLGGPSVAFTVAVLGVLETSLSFDNAVVNASVLQHWDEKWKQRFLVWGMPIAVFGMRLIFPILIVAVTAHLGPIEALMLAINDQQTYSETLLSVHHEIAAFGGAFLLMVFLKFFIDEEKDVHWFSLIERPLSAAGRVEAIQLVLTLIVVVLMSSVIEAAEQIAFIKAGVWGLVTFVAVEALGTLIGADDDHTAIKAGVGGFIYLEVLDASFSFDGVIAAFALTTNIFVIMLGLGVGAMFVRSMTLHLVESGKLTELRYLEHSAFWGIGVLATLMFIGTVVHVPEMVVGLLSAAFIVAGVTHSIILNRKETQAVVV